MNTVTSNTTTATIDNNNTTSEPWDNNTRQRWLKYDFLHQAIKGQSMEILDDPTKFSEHDLQHYTRFYRGGTLRDGSTVEGLMTRKMDNFSEGIKGEAEHLLADRAILKARGDDLTTRQLKRFNFVVEHYLKLEAVCTEMEKALARRKADKLTSQLAAVQSAPVVKVIRQGAVWVKDRDVTKAEALEIADLTEEKLLTMLKDSKIHSSSVICIFSDKERLSFEKNGAAIRYIIEKRS